MGGVERMNCLSAVRFLWNLDRKNSQKWGKCNKSRTTCRQGKKRLSLESIEKGLSNDIWSARKQGRAQKW